MSSLVLGALEGGGDVLVQQSEHGWGHLVSCFSYLPTEEAGGLHVVRGFYHAVFKRTVEEFYMLFHSILLFLMLCSFILFYTVSSFEKEMSSFSLSLWQWLGSTCRNGQAVCDCHLGVK